MIDGFIEVSINCFLTQIWPKISRVTDPLVFEPLQSNWRSPQDECFPRMIIIHWGTRHKETHEKITLAVVMSESEEKDRYWVAPHLLTPTPPPEPQASLF